MNKSFKSLVERKLIPVGKSGNDIIYCCPKCDDNSGHLWVNFHTNKFHCFKCDYAGRSIVSLISGLGIDVRFDYESLENSYEDELNEIIDMNQKLSEKRVVDYSRSLKSIKEYYNWHSMPLSPIARDYLHRRGMSDSIIDMLQIREGVNRYKETLEVNSKSYSGRDYSGRIMVPSLQRDGTVSYFVARDYIGDKKNKYLNPSKDIAFSSEDVWNLDTIDSEHVIICEGVFTAISIIQDFGKNIAVATYGKSIASKSNSDNPTITVTSQGEKLLNKNFRTYIVFYDKDARDSALSTCKYLYDRGATVKLVTINTDKYGTHADANDLSLEEKLECIANAKVYNEFTLLEDLY